jgi:hypothetical protein
LKRMLKQVKMTFHTRDLVLIEEALKRYFDVLVDHYHALMLQADVVEKEQLAEIAIWIRKSSRRIQEQYQRVSILQKAIHYGIYPGALMVEDGETEIPPQFDPKQFGWEELGEDQDYHEVMYPEWKWETREPWSAAKLKKTPQTPQDKMREIRQWGNELERHIRQIQADRMRLMMSEYPEPKQELIRRMRAYYKGLKDLLEHWEPPKETDVENENA